MTDLVIPTGATWEDLRERLHDLLGTPEHPPRDDGAVVVATSGSSGTPKRVRIPGSALRASGLATAEVLGGHGQWVLALPSHHVAGLQVLARSALAGTTPIVLPAGMPFTPDLFAAAASQLGDSQLGASQMGASQRTAAPLRLTSLVPTQLRRLVDDAEGRAALARLDAVLLGGSAADPDLLDRARATGCRILHTYGMSETSGGCVYDGVPLPGVRVRVDPIDDRVHLGGPMLAAGYVDNPELSAERFVEDAEGRWFVTDDRGVLATDDGGALDETTTRLRVLGRVDDVIVTGGHKVEPRDVETALRASLDVDDVLVVGLPDPEWGQVVAALIVRHPEHPDRPALPASSDNPAHPDTTTWLAGLRDDLRTTLPPHALPRLVTVADAIPLLPSGKPDRTRAALLLREGGRIESLPT